MVANVIAGLLFIGDSSRGAIQIIWRHQVAMILWSGAAVLIFTKFFTRARAKIAVSSANVPTHDTFTIVSVFTGGLSCRINQL